MIWKLAAFSFCLWGVWESAIRELKVDKIKKEGA
jgi:hypothetical protein